MINVHSFFFMNTGHKIYDIWTKQIPVNRYNNVIVATNGDRGSQYGFLAQSDVGIKVVDLSPWLWKLTRWLLLSSSLFDQVSQRISAEKGIIMQLFRWGDNSGHDYPRALLDLFYVLPFPQCLTFYSIQLWHDEIEQIIKYLLKCYFYYIT